MAKQSLWTDSPDFREDNQNRQADGTEAELIRGRNSQGLKEQKLG